MPDMPPIFRMPGDQMADARRLNAHQRGYTRRWNAISKRYRALNPFCVTCAAAGRDGVPAEHVDHIVPHRGNRDLFLDPANWQSLCASCHATKTAAGQ